MAPMLPIRTSISRFPATVLALVYLVSLAGTALAADRATRGEDGEWIAFQSRRDGARELYLISPDTGEERRLTHHRSHDGYPHWSPDGKSLVFNSERVGWWKVWAMTAEGGEIRQLTHSSSWDSYPKWSPDGQKIVFASGRKGNAEIYVIDADGDNERNLTRHPANDNLPCWSPEGQIVFVSDRGGDGVSILHRMDTDGKNLAPLGGDTPLTGNWPTFSPDGQTLALVSGRDGDEEIFLYRLADGDLRQLTHNDDVDKWPSFSPDGRRLVFASERGGNWDLYLVDLESGDERRLTHHPAMDMTPSWKPTPP